MTVTDPIDIACEIDDVGSDIIIEEIVSTSFNKYGDATDTTGRHTGFKAIVHQLTYEDQMQAEGLFRNADAIFYMEANETTKCLLKRRNKLIYNLEVYEIFEPIAHEIDNEIVLFEIRAKKI